MTIPRTFVTIALFLLHTFSFSQEFENLSITVEAGPYDRVNTLVSADLAGFDLDLAVSRLVLTEKSGGKEVTVPSQLDITRGPSLYWKINGTLQAGKSKTYQLKKVALTQNYDDPESGVKVVIIDGNPVIKSDGKNILQYNLNAPPLPEGVPEIYKRAGFIHPIWSPEGEVLSRIQPPDHYHHVGLWNPWTHTEFKGKEIDFWNLVKGQGTVKPVTLTSLISDKIFGGFSVIQDHIDLNGLTPEGFEVALKEEWQVRVWKTEDGGSVIDFVSTLNCATDSALTIKEYRYEGFGFRATEKWDDNTAVLLTSQGKGKADGNGTRARWCDVNGIAADGRAGILFMTHPANYNYPEPIRIWPVGANDGKENVFFNFNPAMDRDWVLSPGKDYRLRYRMFVYDGKISPEKAESLSRDFASPPKVTVTINKK